MTVIERLREEISGLLKEEDYIIKRINTLPASLPEHKFNSRLNSLETQGILLEKKRKELEKQLALVEQAVREETAAVY